MSNNILIRATNLYKIYGNVGIQTAVIKGISLKVKKGEKLILIGPSGSGKTTLVNMLIGETKPNAGQIFWETARRDISKLSKNELVEVRRNFMSLINQDNNLLPQLSVKDNILLPANLANQEEVNQKSNFRRIIELVNIEHLLDRKSSALSQGEKKRVNIAAALITSPKILIADEPVEGLDPVIAERILDLFDDINRELGTTLIMTSHDQGVAERGTRILELSDGVLSGAHDNQIDLVDLEKTRKLVIDSEGRIKIPEDVMNFLGNPTVLTFKLDDRTIYLDLSAQDENLMGEDIYFECLSCKKIQDEGNCTVCGQPTVKIG